MSKYKLSDFKIGQTAYIELTGNAARGREKNSDECIKEVTIKTVGRKYVTAIIYNSDIKFVEKVDSYYEGLREVTNLCVDYILYPNKQDILNKFEKNKLVSYLNKTFCEVNFLRKLSTDKLKRIKEIVDEEE